MKIDSRTQAVLVASSEIQLELLKLQEKFELTDLEMMLVLIKTQQLIMRDLIRDEGR